MSQRQGLGEASERHSENHDVDFENLLEAHKEVPV